MRKYGLGILEIDVRRTRPGMYNSDVGVNDAGELQLEEDDKLNLGSPTEAKLQQEEQEEPKMMKQTACWDRFLALEHEAKRPWASPSEDTDEYHKDCAVKFFNLAGPVANDLWGDELKDE